MVDTTPVLFVRSSSFSVLCRSGIEYVRTVRLTNDFLASSITKKKKNTEKPKSHAKWTTLPHFCLADKYDIVGVRF